MKKVNMKKMPLFAITAIIGLIVVALVGFGILRFLNSDDKFSSKSDNDQNQNLDFQIDVLNGCGAEDVAFQVAQYLRVKGFDVIDYGDYGTTVNESFIIDHIGRPDIAKSIAKELGIDESQIVSSMSKYYNEFTVVIGKDYIMLKPFKNKLGDKF
jgi:hypothetical protein